MTSGLDHLATAGRMQALPGGATREHDALLARRDGYQGVVGAAFRSQQSARWHSAKIANLRQGGSIPMV